MLLLRWKWLTSAVRIFCSCATVTCRVRLAWWPVWTLFPITAKLLVNWPFWRTQQPAVHSELGIFICPVTWPPIWLSATSTFACGWLWCSRILAKEVPVKRYNLPRGCLGRPGCLRSGLVHVSLAYFRILLSAWDHDPPLKVERWGTAFVYV